MQNRLLALFFSMAAVAIPQAAAAQEPAARVVPTRLERPHYAQIAQSARFTGVIVIDVYVRRDGYLDSAIVVSKSVPFIEQAALQAAWQTEFECRNCTAELTPYTLVYAFELNAPRGYQPSPDDITATAFQTRIRTAAEPQMVMPSVTTVARRDN